jgi:hypothetical protein
MNFSVGPVVTHEYSVDWRLEYIVNRGPFPHVASFARSFIHVVSAEADDSRQLRRADLADRRDVIFGFEKVLDKDPGRLLFDAARRRLTAQLDEISGDGHSLASFDSSRYYPGELPQQRGLGSKLLRIIQAVVPDSCEDDEGKEMKRMTLI